MNATDLRFADLDDKELRGRYNYMINKVYGEIQIGRSTYSASRVLEEIDPTAYRCGFAGWRDGIPEPWQCDCCGETYKDEEEAEECCQEECD
jgi:hypothetical protein